ncbi:DUF6299 family protein [Streptomyces phyllanthi]|uniref:DUF6299 domain-containing protein n=1 Tax=Streptomyces phyllanthi TaxID=1803180 RepID=A0A5N8VYM8_9ACTN|nr:DUF6299 family protein [Streptomyces phyllanthi]MPY39204.1 hypothetical protein [Streptomyces phyllanthi]
MWFSRAVGAAVCAAMMLTAPSASAAAWSYSYVTIDARGHVAEDGTLTLSGTYRCDKTSGPVYLASNIRQSHSRVTYAVNGATVVCDGDEHEWVHTNRAQPGRHRAGPASVKVNLMELRTGINGLPTPYWHAKREQDITLVEGTPPVQD